jgi:hypothetical protein
VGQQVAAGNNKISLIRSSLVGLIALKNTFYALGKYKLVWYISKIT